MIEILKKAKKLPLKVSTRDLVKIGLYPNYITAFQDRETRRGPVFTKVKSKIVYDRNDVVKYLNELKVIPHRFLPKEYKNTEIRLSVDVSRKDYNEMRKIKGESSWSSFMRLLFKEYSEKVSNSKGTDG